MTDIRRTWICALLAAAALGAAGCEARQKDETMHSKETSEAPAETQQVQRSAIAFADKKGWRPEQYRVEIKPNRPDGKRVVHLMYLEDERAAVPGGGQSVELFLDAKTFEVVEVYRFQ